MESTKLFSKRRVRTAAATLTLLMLSLSFSPAFGQGVGAGFYPSFDPAWKTLVSFYFWSSNVNGTGTVGNTEIPIDVDLDGLLQDYFSGSLRIESRKDKTNLGFDFTYFNVGNTREINATRDAVLDLLILKFEVFGSYRLGGVRRAFEPMVGFRYVNLQFEGQLRDSDSGVVTERAFRDTGWLDPFVGARYIANWTDRVVFIARGDVGGFGVGSDLVWQVAAGFAYRMTPGILFGFQYRWMDTDYETSSGENFFKFDIQQQGLLFGIIFAL